MGEHGESGSLWNDAYFWNFVVLMFLTVIEVGAVGLELSLVLTAVVLIGVAVVKGIGIAGLFMHLKGDPRLLTWTALFPVFFVIVMLLGVAFTSPNSPEYLPAWCRLSSY